MQSNLRGVFGDDPVLDYVGTDANAVVNIFPGRTEPTRDGGFDAKVWAMLSLFSLFLSVFSLVLPGSLRSPFLPSGTLSGSFVFS